MNPCWYHGGDHPYESCPDAGIAWIEPWRTRIQQIVTNPKDDS
jgi:hypothetical protein